jgi:hypothetical protein
MMRGIAMTREGKEKWALPRARGKIGFESNVDRGYPESGKPTFDTLWSALRDVCEHGRVLQQVEAWGVWATTSP